MGAVIPHELLKFFGGKEGRVNTSGLNEPNCVCGMHMYICVCVRIHV